jgi:DNA-binding transcriptional ArsR family regulator
MNASHSPTKAFDFELDDQDRLLEEFEPNELFAAVKALKCWTERSLACVDAALTYWTSTAMARPRDREGLGEIRSLIRRLQAIQPLEHQPDGLDIVGCYQRWNGLLAVLETRAHLMDHHPAESIAQRAHMPALKQELTTAAGEMATQELLTRLGLSKARLSQLLALAEAAGLVERRKQGKANWVRASGLWRVEVPKTAKAPSLPAAWRGMDKLAA